MSSRRLTKEEYSFEQRDLAEFMAFLCDSALYFDDKEDKYILLDKEQINRRIKDAYDQGDYLKANTILRTAKMVSSAEIEKMFREVTVRSLPLTFGRYLLIASKALRKEVSPQDIVRRDLCEEFDRILTEELFASGVDKDKLDMLKESLNRWRAWSSKKPEDKVPYFWDWEFDPTPSLRETVHEYIRMKLSQKCTKEGAPEQMVEFLTGHIKYAAPPFSLEESMTKRNDSIFFKVRIWGIFMFDELSTIKKELLKHTRALQEKVEKCWGWDDAEFAASEGKDEAIIGYSLCPSVELKVELKRGEILFDGIQVSQDNKEKLENLVFTKLSLSPSEHINTDQIRKESEEALKKGDFSKAYELNKALSEYKVAQEISTWIIESLLDDLGNLEPVTFSIPKILSCMFDAYKVRVYSRFGIQ